MSTPTVRRLRGYAFDPSHSVSLETHMINEVTYEIPWDESLKVENGVLSGEYIEIIDYDPSTDTFYDSFDPNDPNILAENGLSPSESNPKFHQQMVYSVVMTTIKNFEKALGRKVLWATRRLNYDPEDSNSKYEEYVDKLRIYPHALREANAYYSPQKKALLFGYFHSNPADQADQMPGSLIFTCLSHDIIAHEVTHAILDGMHKHYNEATNPDVLAFHEVFSDIVALFQHFSFPEVLRHQIASTRGDLSTQNLLGELAQQFGVAIGNYGSLRSAIGEVNPETKKWEPKKPDPRDYLTTESPHERGSILVAAVFEAFLSIYNRRVEDLYRIASNGTGILPQGELHPDLVNRLSLEASKTAKHILNMCIRAIDYCPPVDITFGEYLRAIITADVDTTTDDPYAYRLAFIEAFKKRGIFPIGIKSLSVESLQYKPISMGSHDSRLVQIIGDFLRDYSYEVAYQKDRETIFKITSSYINGEIEEDISVPLPRLENNKGLHERINIKFEGSDEFVKLTGLVLGQNFERFGIRESDTYEGYASFQVFNLRLVSRVGPDGKKVNQVVFGILQRCGAKMKNGELVGSFPALPSGGLPPTNDQDDWEPYQFRGGATFILDLDDKNISYIIPRRLVLASAIEKNENLLITLNKKVIENQWAYITGVEFSEVQNYFNIGPHNGLMEAFALLHQH